MTIEEKSKRSHVLCQGRTSAPSNMYAAQVRGVPWVISPQVFVITNNLLRIGQLSGNHYRCPSAQGEIATLYVTRIPKPSERTTSLLTRHKLKCVAIICYSSAAVVRSLYEQLNGVIGELI